MKIKSLSLKNFKNYKDSEFIFSDRINVISGENAQGKTNLLEAIFYLSCVKTIHAKKEKDLILFDETDASLFAEVETAERNFNVKIDVSGAPRRIFVNGVRQEKVTEYIGNLQCVLFIPDDLSMIKEGPFIRRRFLNIAISQLKPKYLSALSIYNKVLEQKNKLLKNEKVDDILLDVYNEKLAKHGAEIIRYRRDFVHELQVEAEKNHYEMSSGREKLQIVYKTDRYITPENDIEEALLRHMNERRAAEKESEMSLIGPHRDDLVFMINSVSAKDFASQGQIRTAILSTKLAEREVFYKLTGEYPILLLDDVLSELDTTRQNFVLNKIDCGQVFITSCENLISPNLECGKLFEISKGGLKESREF
ncbi:MAG: DNA replication/repair protein RecF [Clostridia bacterium]|nr:DNA replication/repair protein RecF [Clostridia bacterium]